MGTVAVYAENQQKAKQFWAEKAGFDIAADHPTGPEASWLGEPNHLEWGTSVQFKDDDAHVFLLKE
ncbi:hypothetical protein [Bacillus vallismortis]|uniref:hypothetical protein n=1 Tax=Bacillus vallismortis TaxID=72361 RepID=UPI002091DE48|nr:hypothetical protein [Bacillus vallismortis]MCO4851693.1 hypothetical protein [Bacillus vallismortis]